MYTKFFFKFCFHKMHFWRFKFLFVSCITYMVGVAVSQGRMRCMKVCYVDNNRYNQSERRMPCTLRWWSGGGELQTSNDCIAVIQSAQQSPNFTHFDLSRTCWITTNCTANLQQIVQQVHIKIESLQQIQVPQIREPLADIVHSKYAFTYLLTYLIHVQT